jgi:hypothetical protein
MKNKASKDKITPVHDRPRNTDQDETIKDKTIVKDTSKEKEPNNINVDIEQGEITEKPITKKTRKFGKGPANPKQNPQEPPKDNSPKEYLPQ